MTKLEMLTETYWSNSMIQEYFGISSKTAVKVRKKAIDKFDGYCVLFDRKTKRDSIFSALGLNVEHEIALIKNIEGGDLNEEFNC